MADSKVRHSISLSKNQYPGTDQVQYHGNSLGIPELWWVCLVERYALSMRLKQQIVVDELIPQCRSNKSKTCVKLFKLRNNKELSTDASNYSFPALKLCKFENHRHNWSRYMGWQKMKKNITIDFIIFITFDNITKFRKKNNI